MKVCQEANFTEPHNISTTAGSVRSVHATDVDGGGDMDILCASFNDDRISWYENDGNVTEPTFTQHSIPTYSPIDNSYFPISITDVDGDNDMDIVAGIGEYG
ncbi:FG-GAP repeat domain-containing protein [Methanococcoides sp. FTZ1]|uniref:FG-GAP repeat domain-containing protein n=1 Tax=Methanococcoides sp. FTZ1 TaxID=3439061 RepID=UPI003F853C8C